MPATFISDLKLQATGGNSIHQTATALGVINGIGVDCQSSDGVVNILLTTGQYQTGAGGPTTLKVSVEESDDNVTFTPLKTFNTISGAGALVFRFEFLGYVLRNKRYLRTIADVATGTITSLPLCVSLISGKKIAGDGNGALTV